MLAWLWVFLAIIVGIVLLDVVLRLFLDGSTDVEVVEGNRHDVLIVYLPGILARGDTSSQELIDTWQRYGDVMLVSYKGNRFKSNRIAEDVALAITSQGNIYEKIVFIGSSMGGKLAQNVYIRMNLLDRPKCMLIAIDAPTCRADFQPPLDKISLGAWVWWAGPISNLFSKLYFNTTFVEPKEENIEDGVDRERLAAVVKEAKSFPLSWSMDQNRFIMRDNVSHIDSLKALSVVYVRSTRDHDTVRPEAFNHWSTATTIIQRVEVDSTHVGYNERPETWRRAFVEDIFPNLDL